MNNNTQQGKETHSGDIWTAIPIGLGVLALFFVVQKLGVFNIGLGGTVTSATSFVVGLMASVSSCLAMVGGLVLSLSAKVAEDDKNNKKPFYLFHIGRLAGFALFGGALGALGGILGVSFTLGAFLGIATSLVMMILGLNLLGVLKGSVVRLPAGIFTFFKKVEHQSLAPLVIGAGTFFLPCGFTQSMQVAALSSGSFVAGSFIMLAFALGTLPVLALLSFGSASFAQSRYAPLFFKSAGVVVFGLGAFALLAGLAGLGLIDPLFNI